MLIYLIEYHTSEALHQGHELHFFLLQMVIIPSIENWTLYGFKKKKLPFFCKPHAEGQELARTIEIWQSLEDVTHCSVMCKCGA